MEIWKGNEVMASFLEDISPFYGNRERNDKGQTLEQFLEEYDPSKYEQPSVTVDIMVVSHPKYVQSISDGLKVLLIQRGNHPSIGKWALPGGFVDMREDAIDSARRELQEETGLTGVPLEQLRAWGEWKRDPRSRVITIAYLAMVDENLNPKAGDDAADAGFFDVRYIPLSQHKDGGRLYNTFQIVLENEKKGVTLSAKLCQSESCFGMLKERKMTVIENDGFACDHAKIIADGLLYIQGLL